MIGNTTTTVIGSMTMTEEELARHDSKTLLQLLLSADDRCDDLTAERDRRRKALRDGRRLLAIAQDDRVRLLIQLEQCEKRHE